MNALKNKVNLIGRLGTDPELVKLENGNMMSRFSLAINEPYKDKENNEWVESTQWHNIIAWGKSAEIASQKMKKGAEVAIEGRLVNRSYKTKDGELRHVTNVEMKEFLIL